MKKLFLGFVVFILALFISSGAGALSLYIDDSTGGPTTYYGGIIHPSPSSYDDYIGSDFRVTSLTATQANNITTVVLTGPYFTSIYATGSSPYGNIGDLYISSTGWKVNSPADHARADTFDSNEGWNYVISYIDQKVYALDFNGITFSSNEGGAWGNSYRSDQAYRGGYGSSLYDATVQLSADTLTFIFPDLGNVDAMGYHWTMACGNDVVEGGGSPVPEPATMLLLGSGLLGLAGLGRKKFFKK